MTVANLADAWLHLHAPVVHIKLGPCMSCNALQHVAVQVNIPRSMPLSAADTLVRTQTSTKRLTRQQMRAEEEAVNVATQASSNDVPDQQVPSEPEIEGIDEERAAADEQGEQENMHANNGQQPGEATKAVKGGRAKVNCVQHVADVLAC